MHSSLSVCSLNLLPLFLAFLSPTTKLITRCFRHSSPTRVDAKQKEWWPRVRIQSVSFKSMVWWSYHSSSSLIVLWRTGLDKCFLLKKRRGLLSLDNKDLNEVVSLSLQHKEWPCFHPLKSCHDDHVVFVQPIPCLWNGHRKQLTTSRGQKKKKQSV